MAYAVAAGKGSGVENPGATILTSGRRKERHGAFHSENRYEVNYARREGQVKVNKKTGAVSPVRGKTHVSHGRLVRNN